jgi:hypothetical protein
VKQSNEGERRSGRRRLYHVGSIPKDAVIVATTSIKDIVNVEVVTMAPPTLPIIVANKENGDVEVIT